MNRAERRKFQKKHGMATPKRELFRRDITNQNVKALRLTFEKYSFVDIWKFIFISDLWLPNIGSSVKHQFLFSVLLSIPVEQFKTTDSIRSYEDFESLYHIILSDLPSFPMLEDYSPEADWGEIKYTFENTNYSVLWGCELAGLTDYYSAFELMYLSFDNEYNDTIRRSPRSEFHALLQMQNHLISNIKTQPKINPLGEVIPGKVELPTNEFWSEISNYINENTFLDLVDPAVRDRFLINAGSVEESSLNSDLFHENVNEGEILPAMFIKYKEKYLPIMPRRFFPTLFSAWGDVYKSVGSGIKSHGMPYSMGIVGPLQKYLKDRIPNTQLYQVVSAINQDGSPHELIFAAGIQANNSLLLIFITDPVISSAQWNSHLTDFLPKVLEAAKLISGPPLRMNLNLEMAGVEIQSSNKADPINVIPIIVIPQTKTYMEIAISPEQRHSIFFLEQFLGLIDEAKNTKEMSGFMSFLHEYGDLLSATNRVTPMDKMYEFRKSHAVLVPGAFEPTLVIGNMQGGAHLRFRSLSEFWSNFPSGAWGNPRSWIVIKAENGRISLKSRFMRLIALAASAGSSSFHISFPLEEMTFEQNMLRDFIGQIIQDTLERNKSILSDLKFLNKYPKIQVLIFPKSLLANDSFDHLRHLDPIAEIYAMDLGWPEPSEPGVRIIFDDEKVQSVFQNVVDSSRELELLKNFLLVLNQLEADQKLNNVFAILDQQTAERPRFKVSVERERVIAPRMIAFSKPALSDYKNARKRIASIANSLKIPRGTFEPKEAVKILNSLKDVALSEIDSFVNNLSIDLAIPFLITQIEGLMQKENAARKRSEMAKTHGVDYDIAAVRFQDHQKYLSHHRNFRYLIEKIVQLQPKSNIEITTDQFNLVIAKIDWLQSIYHGSDLIHYDVVAPTISFDEDYIISFTHEENFESQTKSYGEIEEKLRLGIIGNSKDRVRGGVVDPDITSKLNSAMLNDFGFTYEELVNVATALAQWPHHSKTELSAVYSASISLVIDVLGPVFPDFAPDRIAKVVDFLTLKSEEMLKVLGDEELASDLPVWEYSKRPARFNLRPILEIGEKIFWGPHSIFSAMHLWANAFLSGASPITLNTPHMTELIQKRKKSFDDLLEDKTFEITKRHTSHVLKNLQLHELDKKRGFPPEIGEFDTLAFFPEKKLIVSIEAKNLNEAYCAKDARRLRNQIFGILGKDKGYIGKVERRHQFLEANWKEVASTLKWPIDGIDNLEVQSLYVAQRSYWWTMYPPVTCSTKFTIVELLDDHIKELLKIH